MGSSKIHSHQPFRSEPSPPSRKKRAFHTDNVTDREDLNLRAPGGLVKIDRTNHLMTLNTPQRHWYGPDFNRKL